MLTASDIESQKRLAALAAVDLVENGDLVGLGTGSTARYFVEELGARLAAGRVTGVRCVATSLATERLAGVTGLPLVALPASGVDLAVDGMDEVDDGLRAIKGLGGALTREKIVAAAARRFVLIGDAGKRVDQLGERTPLPVEVLGFGRERTARLLEDLGLEPTLRVQSGKEFLTDNGNPVLDCRVRLPADLEELADRIDRLPGVVDHGLFLHHADLAFLASFGGMEELRRPE
jgi:ribose 5-phosphate isomerase A